ncbi:uncharacterized protein LOC111346015 isoform X2 [Stylophora pistillata]|uniref:uncharacterized protein LOC111346015 isoform X2 n=1 Tax=Stylophora pistillata TaxID=50429 RepID=UPI000C03D293|nr:uncharacterized protein LOC111346015 isoform X2 [Stylophora pistillata]
MPGNLAKFSGLRVFALVLLVIATPQGRQIYDRAKAVEAQRGIKTFTWDAVEDNDHEIHQEDEDEEHDEDSLDLAFEKRSGSNSCHCSVLNDAISNKLFEPNILDKICREVFLGCICQTDPAGNCSVCVNESKGKKRQKKL